MTVDALLACSNATQDDRNSLSEPPKPRTRGRIAKLPRMNNSERGKYYRQKYREYEMQLERQVNQLRQQVHDLQYFVALRNELAERRHPMANEIAQRVHEYFVDQHKHLGVNVLFNELEFAEMSSRVGVFPSHPDTSGFGYDFSSCCSIDTRMLLPNEWKVFFRLHSIITFELTAFHCSGDADAVVIIVQGQLRTEYTESTIDRLFPHIQRNQTLIQRLTETEVTYLCTYQFFFAQDGHLNDMVMEIDLMAGLLNILGSLEDVAGLLSGMIHCTPNIYKNNSGIGQSEKKRSSVGVAPSPMDISFIMS